jgi:hypothetical protein
MSKRKTKDEFIFNAKEVHGDKYDYSLVEYINKDKKVKIICPIHGIFEQRPRNHINQKQGCPICSGVKKSTVNEFISKSKQKHGDKYDYSLVEYFNNKTLVKIICPIHGIFEQTPNNHLNGQDCPLCINNNIKSNKETFIERSKEKYGDILDYSLVEYISNKKKIKLICPKHGIFEQKINNHLNSKMKTPCKKCDSEKRLISQEKVITLLKEIHNNHYDYSSFIYTGRIKKSIIICPIHGEFEQQVHAHIIGSGCKKCSSSSGEKMISSILKEKNIEFIREYKFSNCVDKGKLRFDFYIPSKNICIEYNGLQHYKEIEFFGGEKYFKSMLKKDKIKISYCQQNNIKLLIFKYNDDSK